jgi:hypothetical protein
LSDIKHNYSDIEADNSSVLISNIDQNPENDGNRTNNVAPNRTGVNNYAEDDVWLEANRIVKDWESATSHRSLRGRTRDVALRTAYIQLTKKRGILRRDLQDWYGYNSNYARRKIYLLQKELGLLVPVKGLRSGRLQQYCISTELDKFKNEGRLNNIAAGSLEEGEHVGQTMNTFIRHLAAKLSRAKPTFHKLNLYTELPRELYEDLHDWPVPSLKNKAKVKEFPLGYRRTVKFEIYPEGSTSIYMSSTANAYELHTPKGLVDFFSSLGEARSILKAECHDLRRIPEVTSWKLKIFDKDKTISVSELEKDIPQVMRFWSDEGIRVEHLGEAFQIYGRVMPETGPAFRIEAQSKVENSENVDLADAIIRETFPEIKFKSAFDMLHDLNKRVERMEGKRE